MSDLKAKLASQLNKVEAVSVNDNCDLVHVTDASIVNLDAPSSSVQVVPEFALTFTEAKNRLLMLKSFVQELMIPGVDYGIIPGCSKPSLLKSGAEKLCDIYGFSKLIAVRYYPQPVRLGSSHRILRILILTEIKQVVLPHSVFFRLSMTSR